MNYESFCGWMPVGERPGTFRRVSQTMRADNRSEPGHLVGAMKPWLDLTNEERLNGENGQLLTPSVDHLFDRGFIGFRIMGGSSFRL